MIDQQDKIVIIINIHDSYMKRLYKKTGLMPFRLGEVNEEQLVNYKSIVENVLETLEYLGYKVEK